MALLTLACAPSAWGQSVGSVTYAPAALAGAHGVPTLSQWALWGLALVLGVLAVRSTGRGTARAAAAGLLACAALLGTPWGGPAAAQPALGPEVLLDQEDGGQAPIAHHPDLDAGDRFHVYEVLNDTPRPQRITAIDFTGMHEQLYQGDQGQCAVGAVLAPQARCEIAVYHAF